MTGVEIASLVVAVGSLAVAFAALLRNRKGDQRKEAQQGGAVLTELGYIKSGVDDIKRKQERQDEQHLEVVRDLTAIHESVKQAHHRIDGLERRMNGEAEK